MVSILKTLFTGHLPNIERFRQVIDYPDGFDADIDDSAECCDQVFWVGEPCVGVVGDTALLVGFDSVARETLTKCDIVKVRHRIGISVENGWVELMPGTQITRFSVSEAGKMLPIWCFL